MTQDVLKTITVTAATAFVMVMVVKSNTQFFRKLVFYRVKTKVA